MISIRDYQSTCCDNVMGTLLNGTASTLAVMPTGTGKTVSGLTIVERWREHRPDDKVLWLAHREELIFQPAECWQRMNGSYPVIEMGDFKAGTSTQGQIFGGSIDNRLIVATVQTLNSGRRCRLCTADCHGGCDSGAVESQCTDCNGDGCEECDGRGSFRKRCKTCEGRGWVRTNPQCCECYKGFKRRFLKFDPDSIGLVVMDEAHHSPATTYARVKEYFANARLLGLTATPDRADERAMGQVYETVAFEYHLPEAIADGWLVNIEQQYIVVEDLDFSNVRTTAGDLNEGDLESIIREERMLHRIAAPTIELAGDRPTLAFTPGVSSAERLTEIFNRHKPSSAVCITGTTPRELRRDEIQRFQRGERQYLVGCGVFLEGFDAPATSVICMARPTKSRSLYAQAIGRGTRPLTGTVDGIATPEGRRLAIEESAKPSVLVLDFVGNSGRHKLVSTADILGGEYDDETIELAKLKVKKDGSPQDMREALAGAADEIKKQREALAQKRRSQIYGSAKYTTESVDPFAMLGAVPTREPGWHKGRKPSQGQLDALKKFKIDLPSDCSFWQAHQLMDAAIKRVKSGLSSMGQVKCLLKFGYHDAANMTFKDASELIERIKNNRWQRPA